MLKDKLPPLPKHVFESLDPMVQVYIRALESIQDEVFELRDRVKALEDRLAKNSHNSNKPPGSDGLSKIPRTKSQRGRSGKKPGGQSGHEGNTLKLHANPDQVIAHEVKTCEGCDISLAGVKAKEVERRQIIEIPEFRAQVIEHQAQIKECPHCGHCNRGVFPEALSMSPVVYGTRLKAFGVYLMHQQLIPYDRTAMIFSDFFGLNLSRGSLYNFNVSCYDRLEQTERQIKQGIINSAVVNFDETGLRCEKKLNWMHVASTPGLTFYQIHAKRGDMALQEIGILPAFEGIAVHDHWKSYFFYEDCLHSLCNAHHMRELTFIHEQHKESWAKKMKALLLEILQRVQYYKSKRDSLPPRFLSRFESRYESLLKQGFKIHEKPTAKIGDYLSGCARIKKPKKGKPKQAPGKNLLDRLHHYKACVLRFMYDFSVPFTNNRGEQDIRMQKVKQKISGCFRSFKGAQIFCRIRGYISTSRKQGYNILQALESAMKNQPLIPQYL